MSKVRLSDIRTYLDEQQEPRAEWRRRPALWQRIVGWVLIALLNFVLVGGLLRLALWTWPL